MEGWQGNYRDIDGALHQAMESQKIYSFFEKSAFLGEKRNFLVRFIQMAREWFEQCWLGIRIVPGGGAHRRPATVVARRQR
jgi:hypothetical protein